MSKIKAFSLTELLIVLLIISVTFIIIPHINIKLNQNNSLLNLKEKLNSYKFDKTLSIKCINKCKKCLVFADDKKIDEINLFNDEVIVYNINLEEKRFDDIEIGFENKRVCFELNLDNLKRFNKFIVEYKEKYYLFDPIDEVKIFDSFDEIEDYYKNLQDEIKDSF